MIRRFGRTRVALAVLAPTILIAAVVMDAGALAEVWSILSTAGAPLLATVACAVALVLVGQGLRAMRTKLLIDQAFRSSIGPHLGALSIGYFVNTVAPLRLGELLRAWLLARKLRISFLYTFASIALERLLDIVLVSALLLASLATGSSLAGTVVVAIATISLISSLVLLSAVGVIITARPWTRRVAAATTSWFADPIRRRLQYSIWTFVYGMQRFLAQPRQVLAYLGAFVASWACFLGAAGLLAAALLPSTALTSIVAPFVIASSTFQLPFAAEFISSLASAIGASESATTFAALAWFTLTIPIAAIGFVWSLVFSLRSARETTSSITADLPEPINKLERTDPNFDRLPEFVDAWFQGGELVRVLHELEVRGDLTLVSVFKGGSNAITVLSKDVDGYSVRKIVPKREEPKLRMQHDWLVDHGGSEQIVRVLSQASDDDSYSIALEYRKTSEPLFDLIHRRPIEWSRRLLDDTWSFMSEAVYQLGDPVDLPAVRDAYVQERLVSRVALACDAVPALLPMVTAPRVVVNGVEVLGLDAVLTRIREHPHAWDELARYRPSSSIHGDLTIDNILVDRSTDSFLIIDPSDDNPIRGPIIDVARMTQSLEFGYEFLTRDEDPVGVEFDGSGSVPAVSFHQASSAQYADLAAHLHDGTARELLTPAEQRSVMFHTGLFYCRMLSHRVVIDPTNAAKYFGVGLSAMNHFITAYEE